MIGLDTNVLVRYIMQDDEAQSRLASAVLENECSEKNPGYINIIVICELVWVLERAYEYEKKLIAGVLEQILATESLEVQSSELVWKALRDYKTGQANFSDYLIAHLNDNAGTRMTYTFDKKAAKNKLFKRLH